MQEAVSQSRNMACAISTFDLYGLFIPMIMIGSVANLVVLALFYMVRDKLSTGHYYIISMTFCDLLGDIVAAPIVVLIGTLLIDIQEPLCLIVHSIRLTIYICCFFSVFLTTLDRYWSIIYPIHYYKYATKWIAMGNTVLID